MTLLIQMPNSGMMLDSRPQSQGKLPETAVSGVLQWLGHTIMTKLLLIYIGGMNFADAQSHISQARQAKMSGPKENGRALLRIWQREKQPDSSKLRSQQHSALRLQKYFNFFQN